MADDRNGGLRVAGLFAGIAGIEKGLHEAGHRTILFCEKDPRAQAVLREHYPNVNLEPDVREMDALPEADLVTAGFPCQDLSMAGKKSGIDGDDSSLVKEMFRLLRTGNGTKPPWLMLENVPYMLHLDGGRAMTYLTETLGELGYAWAYRVVDARSFGVPQRRKRVILVAATDEDPRPVLFADDADRKSGLDRIGPVEEDALYGFYWTEGKRGLGWAYNAVPPVKRGSGLGIPSPPGVWDPRSGMVGTPELRDAERLQGFPADWTKPVASVDDARHRDRWGIVGNAVCVPVAEWVGRRLRSPGSHDLDERPLGEDDKWPYAAWGRDGEAYEVDASTRVRPDHHEPLRTFLDFPLEPLSERATSGFLSRARESNLNFAEGFLDSVQDHLDRIRTE